MNDDRSNTIEGKSKKNLKYLFNWLKDRARKLKGDVYILYLAYKHPKTPWYAKALSAAVVAYALSPVDLIPDFIPLLGYLDDLILLPFGIMLAIKLIPQYVIEECRKMEVNEKEIKKKGVYAGIIIILFWSWIIYMVVKAFIKK